jgi:hypothetical protein
MTRRSWHRPKQLKSWAMIARGSITFKIYNPDELNLGALREVVEAICYEGVHEPVKGVESEAA